MKIRLYHFTSRQQAAVILTQGFSELASWVFLTPDPVTTFGGPGHEVLLEVIFELSEAEASQFRHVVADNDLEPELASASRQSSCAWYEIPVAFANRGVQSVRIISADERRFLSETFCVQ